MRRLLATIACDVRLQMRNGFYYAGGFVAVIYIIVLRQLPPELVRAQMPLIVLSNLVMNTFFFIAGLVLLEKGEGTLWARVVTPLRHSEYLISKVVSLGILSVLESTFIIVAGIGLDMQLLPLLLGLILAVPIYTLTGFIAVSKYDSINEYLFPSFLYTCAFIPPFLQSVGLIDSWVMYLHPLQGAFVLAKASFGPIEGREWAYGIGSSVLWIWLFSVWSMRSFGRFIVATEGAR